MRKGKKLLIGNLWKYILVAAVSIFIWSWVYTSLGQIKDNQRLTIGVYNSTCDTQALKNEIAEKLPSMTQQEILELYVDDLYHRPNQTYASDVLAVQVLQSDLVIMPQSLLEQLDLEGYFPELPESIQRDTDYTVDGSHYGVLLDENSPFWQYCQCDEPRYLLLSSNSANLAGLFEKGAIEDDAALRVFEYLTKEGIR